MNRGLITELALALGAASLSAQKVTFGVGGGLLMPMSDDQDSDNMGWQAGVNVTFPVGPVAIRVDGLYGQTTHKDVSGVKVDGSSMPLGANADVVYAFKVAGTIKPYILGGIGAYKLKEAFEPQGFPQFWVDIPVTKFSYNGDAGIEIELSSFTLFLEAR
jgi:opacity protein-like surface antigen